MTMVNTGQNIQKWIVESLGFRSDLESLEARCQRLQGHKKKPGLLIFGREDFPRENLLFCWAFSG